MLTTTQSPGSRTIDDGRQAGGQVDHGAPSTSKQSADEQAADAATRRMLDRGGVSKALLPDAQAAVDAERPAEMIVTAVRDDHPVFAGGVTVGCAEIAAQLAPELKIGAADLRSVTSVELGMSPDAATVGFSISGDTLSLKASGLSSIPSMNLTSYLLHLATGKSVLVSVRASSFHTDMTEWERHGLELGIAQSQETIDSFTAAAAGDQKIADRPPPADVGHEQADLGGKLAALDDTNAQIARRVADLDHSMDQGEPAYAALAAESLAAPADDPKSPANQIAAAGKALELACGQLAPARQALEQKLATATAFREAFQGGPLPKDAATTDAAIAELQPKVAELEHQVDARRAALDQLLGQQSALLEQLLEENESMVGGGQPAGQTLRQLIGLRTVLGIQIADLRRVIAEKLAEPKLVADAARSRVQSDSKEVQDAKVRIAEARQRLAHLGKVWVTLGPDGDVLPPPTAKTN